MAQAIAHFLRGRRGGTHSLRRSSRKASADAGFGLVRRLQFLSGMETRTPKKILVATDFSDGSDEALDRAIEMAAASHASLEIMHVLELAEEFPFGSTYFDADYGALYSNIDRQLTERAERARAAGIACETKIIDGGAVNEITRRGRAIDADLIVVGTHGRTGLAHALMGSVAERVVRRASCPVLTVPFSKKAA